MTPKMERQSDSSDERERLREEDGVDFAGESRTANDRSSIEHWRSLPDDSRETWAFLGLEITTDDQDPQLTGWRVATGNATRIVRLYRPDNSIDKYSDPRQELYEILEPLRLDEVILHTSTLDTICHLRTQLLKADLENPTLRGFRHVSLVDVVDDHFASVEMLSHPLSSLRSRPNGNPLDDKIVELLWQLRRDISHLVPEMASTGHPL